MPDVARVATVRAEPQAMAKAFHEEQAEIAVRAGNRLHADDDPLALGLVFVLQSQFGTDFVRTKFETALFGGSVDILEPGSILEAQLLDAYDDQIDVLLFGGHAESGLAEDVVGPVTDSHPAVIDGLAKAIGILDARAESDPLPGLGVGGNLSQHREHLLQTLGVFNPSLHLCR